MIPMKRTLILGAGFGGLTVATELRRLLGDDHEIVLIDRPEPTVRVLEASEFQAEEKRRFETERLQRWFGR